jgi:hypothetical protein
MVAWRGEHDLGDTRWAAWVSSKLRYVSRWWGGDL